MAYRKSPQILPVTGKRNKKARRIRLQGSWEKWNSKEMRKKTRQEHFQEKLRDERHQRETQRAAGVLIRCALY